MNTVTVANPLPQRTERFTMQELLAEPDFLTVRESFTRIADRIELTLGHPACKDYLASLLIADREDRMGFSRPVFLALMRLQANPDVQP